jgi:hypothetical protein
MNFKYYHSNLKDALKNLIAVKHSIYGSIIDISMQGELSEWNDSVPIGEFHEFDFEIFKNSDDINIQLLVELFEKVNETFETIKGINYIDLDDE